jgi:hypothetical protein
MLPTFVLRSRHMIRTSRRGWNLLILRQARSNSSSTPWSRSATQGCTQLRSCRNCQLRQSGFDPTRAVLLAIMKAKRSDRLIMLTCGRDNDWRSGRPVGANADRIWGEDHRRYPAAQGHGEHWQLRQGSARTHCAYSVAAVVPAELSSLSCSGAGPPGSAWWRYSLCLRSLICVACLLGVWLVEMAGEGRPGMLSRQFDCF